MSPEDVDRFKSLGVEVCIDSPGIGEVWLVPKHTDEARLELTPDEAGLLGTILRTFPGSMVSDMRLEAEHVPPR